MVEEDNYVQRFTSRAYIMIFETLQGHVTQEQQGEKKRRVAQRGADPVWLAFCGAATTYHWDVVGLSQLSRSVLELGQHLLTGGCPEQPTRG